MIELKPGLRWARPKLQTYEKTPYAWCIVEIEGHTPFMENEIIYEMGGPTKSVEHISNPEDWEWGPEINIPDRDWVQIREAE